MSSSTIGGPEFRGSNEPDHGRKKAIQLCELTTTTAGQVACSIGPIPAAATCVNERVRRQKLLVALSVRGECLYAAGEECIALQRRTQSQKK